MTRRLITLLAVAALGSSSVASAQFLTPPSPWVSPVGIPEPPFGVRQQPPARPAAWPGAPVAGSYYIDRSHSAATDSSNPYGYPNRPRQTIPTSLTGPAYVEVRGSGYNASGALRLSLNGTSSAPIWIVGVGQPSFTGSDASLNLTGQYFVVQGLRLLNTKLVVSGSYGAVRQTEITGSTATSGSMMSVGSGAQYIVFFNNFIHDNGPIDSSSEADLHGLKVSTDTGAHHIWYLDNHSYHNSGDSVQLGSASPSTSNWANSLYIGRNVMHDDRENACDLKAVRDVIVSSNVMYGYVASGSSAGETCIAHDGTERVWLVNNVIHSSTRGAVSTGAVGFYVLGNLIYNINEPGFSSTSLSNGHAVMTRNTANVVVAGNTIHNVNHGIGLDGTVTAQVFNNIVAGVASSGHHIGFQSSSSFSNSLISNNVLGGSFRVTVGSTVYDALSEYENGGNKTGSKAADPLFVSPPSNYRLSSSSPALSSGYSSGGSLHPIYGQFLTSNPGASAITVDLGGSARPASPSSWSLGVFQGSGGAAVAPIPPPAAPLGIRVLPST